MMRRLIYWFLSLAFVWFIFSRLTELKRLFQTFLSGDWWWLLAAILLQVLYFWLSAYLYKESFALVGIKRRVGDIAPIVLGSLFVNVLAPTAGTAGIALFVDDAKIRKQSTGKIIIGVILAWVADYGVFALITLLAYLFLYLIGDLTKYEFIAVIALLLLVAILFSVILTARFRPKVFRLILVKVQKMVNFFAKYFRFKPLPENWSQEQSLELINGSRAISFQAKDGIPLISAALMMHIVSMLSLFSVFLAFYRAVPISTLIVGYTTIVLFWIVAPTPQGIGIVEGLTALILSLLGVPGAVAAVVVLVFRGISLWLPIFAGFFFLRRVSSFRPKEEAISEVWGVRIAALAVALTGLINIVSAIRPALHYRFSVLLNLLPLEALHGARLTAALAGFALLILSLSLWRRKKAAWLMTIVVLIVSAFSNIFKGLDIEEASIALILVIWLFSIRAHFHAQSDRPSVARGISVLVTSFLFTLIYGATGFYLLDRQFGVNFNLAAAIRQTITMFTEFHTVGGLQPVTRFGSYFIESIYVIGAATLGYALLMIIRPVLIRRKPTKPERDRAEEIVVKFGHSSMAPLVLLPDKNYFFSDDVVFAYTVKGRTALVLGDPIGPAESVERALKEFGDHCNQHDWYPVYYQTLPENLDLYKKLNYETMPIGQEAVVKLEDFSLGGGENKPLRTPYNRINNLGYAFEVKDPSHSNGLLYDLEVISDEWLTMTAGAEKRFSLGWFDREYLNRNKIALVRNEKKEIVAFATILPEFQLSEVSIDLMRKTPTAENGVMEFFLISLFEWARAGGYKTFNLGLSPFSFNENKPDRAVTVKAMKFIYEHLNRFYHFKGLHYFKEKFHPDWQERYLIYSSLAILPNAALAIVRANAGDDFWIEYLKMIFTSRGDKKRKV